MIASIYLHRHLLKLLSADNMAGWLTSSDYDFAVFFSSVNINIVLASVAYIRTRTTYFTAANSLTDCKQ